MVAVMDKLNETQIKSYIDAHNKYRGYVNNPYAASMPALVWDDYLERETQAYTDKCYWGHSTSESRRYFDGTYVGENLYAKSGTNEPSAEDVVAAWYSEVVNYSYPTGSMTETTTGHYTQVVWAKSTRVGCSISYCEEIDELEWSGIIVGCRYVHGGNYNHEAPYVSSDKNCNTCAAMGYQCGTYIDNCSKEVTCNSCNSSERCVDHMCVFDDCVPLKTCNEGYECGEIGDGCYSNISCGTCTYGVCNTTSHKCVCTAKTCDDGYECGLIDDGCGGTIFCGNCSDGEVCDKESYECVNCTPKDWCFGYECGVMDDGCGGNMSCGECFDGYTCDIGINRCVKEDDGGNKGALTIGISVGTVVFIILLVIIILFILRKCLKRGRKDDLEMSSRRYKNL